MLISLVMRAIERAVEIAEGQQKLADAIGVTQSQVSHWVNGANVHHRWYQAIEAATGVTAHELLADAIAKAGADAKPQKAARRKRAA